MTGLNNYGITILFDIKCFVKIIIPIIIMYQIGFILCKHERCNKLKKIQYGKLVNTQLAHKNDQTFTFFVPYACPFENRIEHLQCFKVVYLISLAVREINCSFKKDKKLSDSFHKQAQPKIHSVKCILNLFVMENLVPVIMSSIQRSKLAVGTQR